MLHPANMADAILPGSTADTTLTQPHWILLSGGGQGGWCEWTGAWVWMYGCVRIRVWLVGWWVIGCGWVRHACWCILGMASQNSILWKIVPKMACAEHEDWEEVVYIVRLFVCVMMGPRWLHDRIWGLSRQVGCREMLEDSKPEAALINGCAM